MGYQGAKIQISIDAPGRIEFNHQYFQSAWNALIGEADYWSIHGLWPEELNKDQNKPPSWMRDDLNTANEKKLEISTDGQLCNVFTPDSNPNHCVHHLAAGLFLNVFKDPDDLHFESDSVPLSWWSIPQMDLIKNTCNNVVSGIILVSDSMDAPFTSSSLKVCQDNQNNQRVYFAWDSSSIGTNSSNPTSCWISYASNVDWPGDSGHKFDYDKVYEGYVPTSGTKTTFNLNCDKISSPLASLDVTASACSADIKANFQGNDSDASIDVNSGDFYKIKWFSGCTASCSIKEDGSQISTDLHGIIMLTAPIVAILRTRTYSINCLCNSGGSVSDSVAVNIHPVECPDITDILVENVIAGGAADINAVGGHLTKIQNISWTQSPLTSTGSFCCTSIASDTSILADWTSPLPQYVPDCMIFDITINATPENSLCSTVSRTHSIKVGNECTKNTDCTYDHGPGWYCTPACHCKVF